MQVRATMAQEPGGRWTAAATSGPDVRATGTTPDRCLTNLRRAVEKALTAAGRAGDPLTIVVESTPLLAGVAEAARVMGWDKRRVITYLDRGSFPAPIQSLASGRVWRRADVEAFASEWRARRAMRKGS
jgi:hypothetical protein